MAAILSRPQCVNSTFRPRQNGCNFTDDIFKGIFLNRNFWTSNNISLKCVIYGLYWQYAIMGSDNGLAPNRHQVIIWTNDGVVYWCLYASVNVNELTHWGRDKMAAIFQTMFSNSFSWMKMYEFRLRFHRSLFQRVQVTIYQRWFR